MATVFLRRCDCDGRSLPWRCLRCGVRADGLVEQDFFGTLAWIDPLTVLRGPPDSREAARYRVPMCRDHRHHWRNRRRVLLKAMAIVLACLVGVVALAAFGMDDHLLASLLAGMLPLLGLSALFAAVVYAYCGIRATTVEESGVCLRGVSREFVEHYEDDGLEGIDADAALSRFRDGRPRCVDDRTCDLTRGYAHRRARGNLPG